jgi:hypothetical protein
LVLPNKKSPKKINKKKEVGGRKTAETNGLMKLNMSGVSKRWLESKKGDEQRCSGSDEFSPEFL